MRVDPSQHLARPLLIHRLASDFDLLDVWRLPATAEHEQGGIERLVRCFLILRSGTSRGGGGAGFLMAVRAILLRMFGRQDDDQVTLPIPGCSETSLRDRMSTEERARFDLPSSNANATERSPFSPVFGTPTERAYELSNATVHAILHLSWVLEPGTHAHQGYLSVYAKPRGTFGRAYLALISPFRHWLVYPAMMKSIARAWQRQQKTELATAAHSVSA
jgi:hypothetical protein